MPFPNTAGRPKREGISEQMRRFALAYDGNGKASAISVGVSPKTAATRACEWLKHPEVQALISRRNEGELKAAVEVVGSKIKSKTERQAWWSGVMDDVTQPMAVRLKASELLGKSEGDFLDRVETTHALALPKGLTVDELRALAARPLLTDRAASAVDLPDDEEDEVEDAEFSEVEGPYGPPPAIENDPTPS